MHNIPKVPPPHEEWSWEESSLVTVLCPMRHHLLQEECLTEADGLCNSLRCLATQALTLSRGPTKIRLLLILLTFGPSTLFSVFCGYISTASSGSFLGERGGISV